jgi:hypothetical protein
MSSLTVKAKDDIGICEGLIEGKPSKEKGFDFHGISYQLLCRFYLDDGVIASHVG